MAPGNLYSRSSDDVAITMPLAELNPGHTATVLALEGGHGFMGRMVALGFAPGAEVCSVRNAGQGPLIVSVLGTEVALGRGQAMHVRVRAG